MKLKDLFRGGSKLTANKVERELVDDSANSKEKMNEYLGREKYSKAYRHDELEKLEEYVKNAKDTKQANRILKEKVVSNEIVSGNYKEYTTMKKEKDFMVSDLGANLFKTTLFKDELRTPSYEIQRTLESYDEIPMVNSGINQIVLFIIGEELEISSSDPYTQKWFNKWMEQRPSLYEDIQELVKLCEICGNAYIEPVWDTVKINGKDVEYMNDFRVVPDPSRIYFNLTQDMQEDYDYWIYQVPYIFRKYRNIDIKVNRITYMKNGLAWTETVYGIVLPKNSFLHMKMGKSRHGWYGRSYLSSTINNTEILTQILRNYAMAARYMSLGKKIVSVGENDEYMTTEELDDITRMLNDPEDEESIVVNRKLNIEDLAPAKFNDMQGPVEFVRKDISSGMVPNFMTPWGVETTYASANKAGIPFELSLKNKKTRYIRMLNEFILKNVMKQNPKLKDATFKFGDVSLEDPNEIQRAVLDLYNNNLITMNQLLKDLGRPIVENGDIYAFQRNYLAQQKYQLDQADYEVLEEPYMQRSVRNDMRADENRQPDETVVSGGDGDYQQYDNRQPFIAEKLKTKKGKSKNKTKKK